jgi:hypothetical protein
MLYGFSKRLFTQPIHGEGDQKHNGDHTQKDKKEGVMMVIEFPDPLDRRIERIFSADVFGIPFFPLE